MATAMANGIEKMEKKLSPGGQTGPGPGGFELDHLEEFVIRSNGFPGQWWAGGRDGESPKMAKAQAIQALREQGWSYRRIARALRISRVTVKRHVELGHPRAAPPVGSDVQSRPNPPTGPDEQTRPNPPAGNSGPVSRCEPFRDIIIAALREISAVNERLNAVYWLKDCS